MVPRAGASSCWMDTQLPGGKGSWMVLILFLIIFQLRAPSKRRKFVNWRWEVLIRRVGNMESGSNWGLLDCKIWWSWNYHPYLLWWHIVYLLAIWNYSWRCLCHGWIIPVQMAWWVSGLIVQGLGLASFLQGIPLSTKVLVLLASLCSILSPFWLKYAMCVLLIHSKIGVQRERQLCWNHLIVSIGGHFHQFNSCRSQSETFGIGVPRILLIVLALKL